MPTVQSTKTVARCSGLRGHHPTWNDQFNMLESSPMISSDAVTSLVAWINSVSKMSQSQHRMHVIWMPGDDAHSSPSTNSKAIRHTDLACKRSGSTIVHQNDDLTPPSEILDDSVARRAHPSKNIQCLLIPCDQRNLVQFYAVGSQVYGPIGSLRFHTTNDY